MVDWDEQYEQLRKNPSLVKALIAQDLRINDAAIKAELVKQPLLYAKWAYFESRVEEESRRVETDYKSILAQAKNAIRSQGKISVAACDDQATCQQEVKDANEKVLDIAALAGLMKQIRIGLAQKRDMLMSINSRQKAEMELER